jgi:hypothetical protein
MSRLRTFGRFWWTFIVGDDWRAAAGIAIVLGLVAFLAHAGADVWWLLPPAVALVLAASLWRATTTVAQDDTEVQHGYRAPSPPAPAARDPR